MDVNELVEQFEHMPTDSAALLILFMALLVLLVFAYVMMRRDKVTADADKGQTASTVTLANAINTLAQVIPPIVAATKELQESIEQHEIRTQEWLKETRREMGDAGQHRDAQFNAIQTGIDKISSDVEAGMEPKLKEVVDTVTALLDKFQDKLLKQIADLPVVVSTVIENAVADLPKAMIEKLEAAIEKTKADILAEIRADMAVPLVLETAPESAETIPPKSEDIPAGEVATEVKTDGNTL